MRDPERRLSVSSDADALEREVLASLRAAKAPADARAAAWQGIAAGIAVAALPVGATGSSAAAAGSSAGAKVVAGAGAKLTLGVTAKLMLATAVTAIAVGGAYVLAPQRGPERARTVQAPRAATQPKAAAPSVPATTAAPAPVVVEPEAVAPNTTPRAASKGKAAGDWLAEESALLSAARADLRDGDAVSAAAKLKKLRERFPNGALLQERKVLDIDVLIARGQRAAAARAARAFVQRYPNSPHSARLRTLPTDP